MNEACYNPVSTENYIYIIYGFRKYIHVCGKGGQDQDQDSLLVKRRNDTHSPGPVIREHNPLHLQRMRSENRGGHSNP